ncbi:MAG TPA: hypothetical protein VFP70_14715 [Burkholderiales bacterium]|nr:hypothetical protein [Burkholderiales bacterium]
MGHPITIPRTGSSGLAFVGELIDRFAAASADLPPSSLAPIDEVRRRLEVYLYQSDGGDYVVWVICRNEPGGELRRSDAYVGNRSEDLIRQLRSQDCTHAILELAVGREGDDRDLLERELMAHWDNVVQLIELSIEVRARTRYSVVQVH